MLLHQPWQKSSTECCRVITAATFWQLFTGVLVRFSGFTHLFRCVMKPRVKLLNCWGEVSVWVQQLSYSQLAGTETSKCWGWGDVPCCGTAINWNRAELGLRLMNEGKNGEKRLVSPPRSCSRSYWQLWRISVLKNTSVTCLQRVWWWFQEKWGAHLTFLHKMRSHHTRVQKERAVVGKLLPWVRKSELKCNYSVPLHPAVLSVSTTLLLFCARFFTLCLLILSRCFE